MELAPVADLYPSSVKPDFAPLDSAALAERFSLAPGPCALTEAERGIPVDVSALGGNTVAEEPAAAVAPAPKPVLKKIKLKLPVKKS